MALDPSERSKWLLSRAALPTGIGLRAEPPAPAAPSPVVPVPEAPSPAAPAPATPPYFREATLAWFRTGDESSEISLSDVAVEPDGQAPGPSVSASRALLTALAIVASGAVAGLVIVVLFR